MRDEQILSVINTNGLRFEPYADLVDEAYTNWNAELVSNQDAYGHIENFETNGASYNEHLTCIGNNENRSISNFSFGSFMSQILTYDEVAENKKASAKSKRMILILPLNGK